MYFWCYIFYLSKYYELVDTALLMLRGKRVIALHAIHHAHGLGRPPPFLASESATSLPARARAEV